jgi:hypothetical protein
MGKLVDYFVSPPSIEKLTKREARILLSITKLKDALFLNMKYHELLPLKMLLQHLITQESLSTELNNCLNAAIRLLQTESLFSMDIQTILECLEIGSSFSLPFRATLGSDIVNYLLKIPEGMKALSIKVLMNLAIDNKIVVNSLCSHATLRLLLTDLFRAFNSNPDPQQTIDLSILITGLIANMLELDENVYPALTTLSYCRACKSFDCTCDSDSCILFIYTSLSENLKTVDEVWFYLILSKSSFAIKVY